MAMTPQEGTLQLKSAVRDEADVEVFYRHAGDGQPMIWLHWLWGEPGWMPQHERLAERHSLYVPDMPGFGQSGPLPRWASRPRDIAILLLQAIDQWGLERPTVVGSCLGVGLARRWHRSDQGRSAALFLSPLLDSPSIGRRCRMCSMRTLTIFPVTSLPSLIVRRLWPTSPIVGTGGPPFLPTGSRARG